MIMMGKQAQQLQNIRLLPDKVYGILDPNPLIFNDGESFLYGISKIKGQEINFYEQGIGVLSGEYLVRVKPLGVGNSRISLRVAPSTLTDLSCEEDEQLVVETVYPQFLSEIYVEPNSVLVSDINGLRLITLNEGEILKNDGGEIKGVAFPNLIDHLIPVVSYAEPASGNFEGRLWYDKAANILKVYDINEGWL
jgi:hypothetical protein